MSLVSELKRNNGQFKLEDFYDDLYAYERAFKSLLKSDPDVAFKALKHYYDEFKSIESKPFLSYHPGMSYTISEYSLIQYALLEKNKEDRDHAYLILLKRFGYLPLSIQRKVIKKKHLLLKYAYPDLNDLYSDALYAVGSYLFERKRYKEAFHFFKKGADFTDNGRQIEYPFYLMALNQDKVGDMYRDGLGVKKNVALAKRYYRKTAENCGREYHPKMGDFEYEKGNYAKAFLYYTSGWGCYSHYNQWFLDPEDLDDKYEKIFEELNNIPYECRHLFANVALSVMYYHGYGCDSDIEMAKELLPDSEKDWVCDKYEMTF